jgi:hypothetical protein
LLWKHFTHHLDIEPPEQIRHADANLYIRQVAAWAQRLPTAKRSKSRTLLQLRPLKETAGIEVSGIVAEHRYIAVELMVRQQ